MKINVLNVELVACNVQCKQFLNRGNNSIIGKSKYAVEKDRVSQLQEQVVNWKMDVKSRLATGALTETGLNTELTNKINEFEPNGLLTNEEVNSMENN